MLWKAGGARLHCLARPAASLLSSLATAAASGAAQLPGARSSRSLHAWRSLSLPFTNFPPALPIAMKHPIWLGVGGTEVQVQSG